MSNTLSDLSSFLSASVGSGPAFQVTDYDVDKQPIVKAQQGLIGYKFKIEITGYMQASTLGDLSTAVGNILNQPSGVDLLINSYGAPIIELLGAFCMEGGPHYQVTLLAGGNALQRNLKVTITATTAPDVNNSTPAHQSFKLKIGTKADGNKIITGTGTILSNGDATFTALLAGFNQSYPWPNWVVTYDKTATNDVSTNPITGAPLKTGGSTADFTLNAVQLAGPLPAAAGGGKAIDGEITTTTDRDEQERKTTVTAVDLVLTVGTDPQAIATMLRPAAPLIVLKESLSITTIREIRLRASFTVLSGTAGGDQQLLNFTQKLSVLDSVDNFGEYKYEGADPVAVLRPKSIPRLIQSGTATAIGGFLKPPEPLTKTFSDQPRKDFDVVNIVENQTSWSYPLFYLDGPLEDALPSLLPLLGRPNPPEFYPGPKQLAGGANNPQLSGGGTPPSYLTTATVVSGGTT